MTNLTSLLSILFIVFGVLQIILFFKVWNMTNDVSKIKKELSNNNYILSAQIAFLKGDRVKAKEYLDSALFVSLLESGEAAAKLVPHIVEPIKSKYKGIYDKMRFEMPDIELYNDVEKLPLLENDIVE